jgi:hypothetical protein
LYVPDVRRLVQAIAQTAIDLCVGSQAFRQLYFLWIEAEKVAEDKIVFVNLV